MPEAKWYKGNIHTHTTESDGDADPDKVVSWYRRHGYDFLVLSDHNHRTMFEYGPGKRRFKRPLMVPGEEVSVNILQGTVPVHINGIGISRVVEPVDTGDVVSTLQANVDAIIQAGGIASINHPNFKWAFDHEVLKQVNGATMVEVFNGHRATNVYGGPGKPSAEQVWDGVLSAGRLIFGAATDDSHHYHDFNLSKANPGRGWVVARATELAQDAIVDALASGDFYSSTGVALADLEASPKVMRLTVEQDRDEVYTISFTGREGVLLASSAGPEAAYFPSGDEGYVRATVMSSSGGKAWVQPVFIR